MADTQPQQVVQKSRVWPAVISGIVCLVLGIMIGANGSEPGRSVPSADTRGSSSDGPASQGASAAPAAVPQTLLDLTGSQNTTTEKFTAAGDWDMAYDYDCTHREDGTDQGNFIITVRNGDGSVSSNDGLNEITSGRSGVSHFHEGGTFYLEIESECTWHVKATG